MHVTTVNHEQKGNKTNHCNILLNELHVSGILLLILRFLKENLISIIVKIKYDNQLIG